MAIIGTNSTATTAGRLRPSARFGWWPNAICAIRATSPLIPASLTSVTCETKGLMRFVALDGRERAVTLTERGHHLLEAHRRDRDDTREQAFYAGVSRPRELSHDVQLYRAYLREEERLRDQGAEIRRVVLDHELKREYQEWLQERNRGRPDSDGRPDRDRARDRTLGA